MGYRELPVIKDIWTRQQLKSTEHPRHRQKKGEPKQTYRSRAQLFKTKGDVSSRDAKFSNKLYAKHCHFCAENYIKLYLILSLLEHFTNP